MTNRLKRIAFEKDHIHKPLEFWRTVIFSDEGKFCIFGIKGRKLVWRKPCTALQKEHLVPTVKLGGGGVMVWRYMVSNDVAARCWQQWITEGRVYRRGGSGRPRNTNDREDRAIRRVATSAPTTSLASIQRHLPPSRHPVPSRETIRRRLTEVFEEPTSAKTLTTDPTS
ncbi:transposable element Tc1 transposase [Trichonephila clavipes]|nr:transposable element Tc1 transposase [Trichonephila clavipes]